MKAEFGLVMGKAERWRLKRHCSWANWNIIKDSFDPMSGVGQEATLQNRIVGTASQVH